MTDSIQWLPAREGKRSHEPLLLIHGWGCDSRSWQPLLSQLNQHMDIGLVSLPGFSTNESQSEPGKFQRPEAFVEALTSQLPERFFLMGWSLGGMLATQLAKAVPERVVGLVTLASNVSFVADDSWLPAMTADVFTAFTDGFEQSPEVTLKRFAGLMAKGDADERQLLKTLRSECAASWSDAGAEQQASWLQGLNWLQQIDNRQAFIELQVPGLHLLADGDALVPRAVSEELSTMNAQQRVDVIEEAAHALHWSQPESVADKVLGFFDQQHHAVDKSKVADSFGRAASQYDSVAGLQRQIGHRLMDGIRKTSSLEERWLDLGCGTGYFTPLLTEQLQLPPQQMVGLDLSQGMLDFARQERGDQFTWICGDAEDLPFEDQYFQGVFSSLAIQWCAELNTLFAELARVVESNGEVHLATLGPRTLYELRDAWRQVDDYTHVNRFAAESELRAAIEASDLSLQDWRSEDIVLQYDQVRELTYELKTLGAHNMNHGQSSGLTGRQRIVKFKQAYESFRRDDGKLPATYEVFYLTLKKA